MLGFSQVFIAFRETEYFYYSPLSDLKYSSLGRD